MKSDIRLLYLVKTSLCPCPVSVRLPTGSCKAGCYFCCKNSWRGNARYALKNILTVDDFLRLWSKIIINSDFRFVWPQEKILNALGKSKILRFVREDLFESKIPVVTEKVLKGCASAGYGLIVKTSATNAVNYVSHLKKLRHCIVFSITDLLDNYREKLKAINFMVGKGLNVTLSLKPIYEYNENIKYILRRVDRKILGVEVGWLYGAVKNVPSHFLKRTDYKIINREKQYNRKHLIRTTSNICDLLTKRKIEVRYYFSSEFYRKGACCFVDRII